MERCPHRRSTPMPMVRIRLIGSRADADTVITALHGIDGIEHVEEVDDLHRRCATTPAPASWSTTARDTSITSRCARRRRSAPTPCAAWPRSIGGELHGGGVRRRVLTVCDAARGSASRPRCAPAGAWPAGHAGDPVPRTRCRVANSSTMPSTQTSDQLAPARHMRAHAPVEHHVAADEIMARRSPCRTARPAATARRPATPPAGSPSR